MAADDPTGSENDTEIDTTPVPGNGTGDELVEIPAGWDLGTIEVVKARLDGDGIPVRIEPDTTGVIPDEIDGGYRLLLRREDVEAARPVLEIAEIEVPDL